MVLSIIGFMWGKSTTKLRYKDLSFTRTDTGWITNINDKQMEFDNHPLDVEHLNISLDTKNIILATKMVYITYDPEGKYLESIARAQYDLNNKLWSTLRIYSENALTINTTYALPVISCDNATFAVPVIYLTTGNETKIYNEDGCIIIEASSGFAFSSLKDRLLYSLLGVI